MTTIWPIWVKIIVIMWNCSGFDNSYFLLSWDNWSRDSTANRLNKFKPPKKSCHYTVCYQLSMFRFVIQLYHSTTSSHKVFFTVSLFILTFRINTLVICISSTYYKPCPPYIELNGSFSLFWPKKVYFKAKVYFHFTIIC